MCVLWWCCSVNDVCWVRCTQRGLIVLFVVLVTHPAALAHTKTLPASADKIVCGRG